MSKGAEKFNHDERAQSLRWGVLGLLIIIIALVFWQLLVKTTTVLVQEEWQAEAAALVLIDYPEVKLKRAGESAGQEVVSGSLLTEGDELLIARGGKFRLDFLNGDRLIAAGDNKSGQASVLLDRLAKNEQNLALTEELTLGAGQHWLRLRGKVKVGGATISTVFSTPDSIGAGDGRTVDSAVASEQAVFSLTSDPSLEILELKMFAGSVTIGGQQDETALTVVAGEQLTWFTGSPITNADVTALSLPLAGWEQENLRTEQRLLYQQAVATEDEGQKQELARSLALTQAYLKEDLVQASQIAAKRSSVATRTYLVLIPENKFDFNPVLAGEEKGAAEGEQKQEELAIEIPANSDNLQLTLSNKQLADKKDDDFLVFWYFLPLKKGGAVYIEELAALGQEAYQLSFPAQAKPPFFPAKAWPVGDYQVKLMWSGEVLEEKNFRVI